MRSDTSQILLIISGIVVASLFGMFFYREIFPEYRIYQNDYRALEEFRSTYTHMAPPPFQEGVKQIVIEREDKGPATIDRCTSCHVALQIPYFSSTKIAKDLNGNIILDDQGHPTLVPNEEYIWLKLNEKIAELRDDQIIAHLKSQGHSIEADERLHEASRLDALKTAQVGEYVYDVTKVLSMHPLIGNETRPFEFHPLEEYGCTSCHSGNGRGLTTDKAHGPVFDGLYETEERIAPFFTEPDPVNDPRFSHVFNHKPGHSLLFQTEPILVGALNQSRCVQCHQTSKLKIEGTVESATGMYQKRENKLNRLIENYENQKQAVLDLLSLQKMIKDWGYAKSLQYLKEQQSNYILPDTELKRFSSQYQYLVNTSKGQSEERAKSFAVTGIQLELEKFIGSNKLVEVLTNNYNEMGSLNLNRFLKQYQSSEGATGSLFVQGEAIDLNQDLARHAQEAEKSFAVAVTDQKVMSALHSDIDELTRNYQRGRELFMSQACYACHRIAGLSRGGVGPELTQIGETYPWYIKESIVWPQADLATSTMPNMRLDHIELQDLMTFLLAQRGGNRAVGEAVYKADLQAWESGKKAPWEKPILPSQMYDLRFAMTVFATEGCSSCHRLQGFESNVGFNIEKASTPRLDQIEEHQQWFRKLFPEVVHFTYYDEEIPGSEIVEIIEKNREEIDQRIVDDIRENSIIEEIDLKYPQVIESLYSAFRYASRAKDHFYQSQIKSATSPEQNAEIKNQWKAWKERVHRVLMMYIQIYGLGRLIGPHLNWSGIYRSDEWLMEHFHNPSGHVPRSIMPIFPFDDTKFYALTHMLDVLGVKNRNAIRRKWDLQGFNPAEAFTMLCSQCHGIGLVGNGVIAEWIYPIPKNLHDPDFLRNLTKDKVYSSIKHGVKGTPMPPWGETSENKPADINKISHDIPVLSEAEIHDLVNWLFSSLPGGEVIRHGKDVPKWQYSPEDVLEELEKERGRLLPLNGNSQNPTPPSIPEKRASLMKDSIISLVALNDSANPSTKLMRTRNVEDLFDKVSSSTDKGSDSYYIKHKFYTPYNIEQGQEFFLINCAVCHGNEGDGTGSRAQAMQSAKPRMLTNLDWIRSHDDLRLLQSIKYGVPGTAMTPWGDLTNALQRLQLVIFIRSLSEEQDLREELTRTLYQTFEPMQLTIENARIEGNEQIKALQNQLKAVLSEIEAMEKAILQGNPIPKNIAQKYERKLNIEKTLYQLQEQDKQLVKVKGAIKQENDLYLNTGISLLSKDLNRHLLQSYLQMIRFNANRYELKNHQIDILEHSDKDDQIRKARDEIIDELNAKITELEREREVIEGKIASSTQREELSINRDEIENVKKLRARLITSIEEAIKLVNEQVKMISNLQKFTEKS